MRRIITIGIFLCGIVIGFASPSAAQYATSAVNSAGRAYKPIKVGASIDVDYLSTRIGSQSDFFSGRSIYVRTKGRTIQSTGDRGFVAIGAFPSPLAGSYPWAEPPVSTTSGIYIQAGPDGPCANLYQAGPVTEAGEWAVLESYETAWKMAWHDPGDPSGYSPNTGQISMEIGGSPGVDEGTITVSLNAATETKTVIRPGYFLINSPDGTQWKVSVSNAGAIVVGVP